jgi:hypothetical protein
MGLPCVERGRRPACESPAERRRGTSPRPTTRDRWTNDGKLQDPASFPLQPHRVCYSPHSTVKEKGGRFLGDEARGRTPARLATLTATRRRGNWPERTGSTTARHPRRPSSTTDRTVPVQPDVSSGPPLRHTYARSRQVSDFAAQVAARRPLTGCPKREAAASPLSGFLNV